MRGLFSLLRERIEVNAQRAVELYTREVTEYRSMVAAVDDRTDMVDFAIFIRKLTFERAAADVPLRDGDLSAIALVGRQRAELGLSVPSQQQVLGLHTALMLKEIHDASRPDDVADLLRMIGWYGTQGIRARGAYLRGYTDGVGPRRVLATRTELLARALLADEPVEPLLAGGLGVPVCRHYVVSVLRVPAPSPSPEARLDVVRTLAHRRTPAAWLASDELVLLTPGGGDTARVRALEQVRDVAAAVGQPCQVGSADGAVGHLAESLGWAREASRVAPPEDRPTRLYTVADLFVEIAVARTPQVDAWLRTFAKGLAAGSNLVATLHAFYCHDMDRTATAAALRIHPRTLDYRLQRVREITGVDPRSTSGVRVLSTAVARLLAGGPV
ncbi:PucR family transcriptional regulator [Planosporangium sp. 12N6]|uniref:PucR family transcriptional regulator n=1 Tax=Planosporangium spinosum TaxID=3402278 RepID=UPI003CF76203